MPGIRALKPRPSAPRPREPGRTQARPAPVRTASPRPAPAAEAPAQRAAVPAPAALPAPAPAALPAGGPGQPLPEAVAEPISSSLGLDLGAVRVHSDENAAAAAKVLSARAFTVGPHVFLGEGERPTNVGLVAHEVAHVAQQQAAPRVQLFSPDATDPLEREARGAAAAVAAREPFTVRGRTPERVQRLGISDALDYFADKANLIPGYRMFTIVLGVNPINMSRVDRSAANILRAMVELIPGGGLITQALDNYGIFERVGGWVEQQIRTLGMTGATFRKAINDFLDSLGWRDIFHLGDLWDRAKRIFTTPIRQLIDFGAGLVSGIVTFIKDAILRPLASLASGTRGWDLLIAVLGKNPITGEAVPRNADTLIGGFMKLIGQEEVWNNLKQARAVERAWAWFQGVLSGLLGYVLQIPQLFLSALHQLELGDIVILTRAFSKIARVFGGFIGDFIGWAGRQVLSLLQIIFEVLAPAVMPYIRKAMGAFREIIRNPVHFIGNLVRAGIQGFRQFGANFLQHLRRSLIEWLTGTLSGAGVYIPQAFELREIIKFVLSVLGLTWQNVRAKLLRLIPEGVLHTLETGFDLVVALVHDGPAAAWDKIREQISNLREMVMEQIMSFVQSRIVQAAITRLVTSLNPAGAFIQAVIAIYNTVMFFVERLRQIGQVATAFIDSISAIAAGAIGSAANRVEQTMGGLLTLVISFLARLVGLGRVSDAVKNIVDRIRAPIDRALDRVADWIVGGARRVGRLFGGSARPGGAQAPAAASREEPFAVEGPSGTERHRVVLRPGADGQPHVYVASDEAMLRQVLDHYEPRLNRLPASARDVTPHPPGWRENDQPRTQASSSISNLRRVPDRVASVDQAFAPGIKDDLARLLHMFAVYDRPAAERLEEAPVRGQQMSIRLTLRPVPGTGPAPAGVVAAPSTSPGGRTYRLLTPDPMLLATATSRGAVYEEQAGEVIARTWATGGTAYYATNTSHTEAQFDRWLAAQSSSYLARISAIEIRSNLSACSACTDVLTGAVRRIRTAQAPGNRVLAAFYWDKLYRSRRDSPSSVQSTEGHHIGQLRSTGWLLYGPMP